MGGSARPAAPSVTTRISRATQANVPDVVRIEGESFSDPWSEQSFRELVEASSALFLVAVGSDGRVLGYTAAFGFLEDGEILNVAVDSTARREGIGGLLLDAAIAALRERNAERVYLEVRESNEAAIGLYQSRGFAKVNVRRNYYRRPVENALVLKLEL